MNFFANPSINLSVKLLEVLYIFMGIILLYTSFRSFRDKTNQHAYGTNLLWGILGILIGFGRFIPPVACGVLILVMTIPTILQKVTKGESRLLSKEYMEKISQKLGAKILIPALGIGVLTILLTILTILGALVGVGVGVSVVIFIMTFFSKDNTPKIFFDDTAEILETVGPLSTLPMLSAYLGAIFTSAGIDEIISKGASTVVPARSVNVGAIIYAVGMVIFTAIMGNAFVAVTMMTVGISVPFVFSLGVDPALVGMVALICGLCSTLLTPMVANFNAIPVAVLETKDKYGVIENQLPTALLMLIFQVVYMILFKQERMIEMKVVITGSGPFGGEAIGPAFEVVKELPAGIARVEIVKVEAPIVFGTSGEEVVEAAEIHQPDMVICAGQAGGRQTITAGKMVINLVEARIPGNVEQRPSDAPLIEDGATAYLTNLPIKAMVKNCHGHQLSAAISYTAGTFVYNNTIYHLLHLVNTKYPIIRDGFIHVPFLPERTIDKPVFASMSLGVITDFLFYMIEAAVKTQEDIQLQGGTTY